MEQRQERELTGATDCATLSSAISRGSQDDKSSAVRFQLRKELFSSRISPYLEGCYKFVALINPQTDASKQFLDTTEMGSDNAAGKIYVNIIQLLNGPTTPNLSILASNPLTNIFDASKALAAKSTDVLKSNMAADATLQMLRTEFAGKDELLDSLLVSQYADLVTKVSPLVSLYERYKESTDDSGSSNIEVLERMMQSDSSYREWLGNLMQIVNINIAQQSLLSGLSVIGSGQFNVQALSPADDSKIDCSKTVDSLFCLLNSDQQVRSNVLKFSLYRDLKNKTLGTISYNYVTTLPRSSDQDLDVIIASLKSSLASSWNFTKGKMPDGSSWIIAHFAKQSEPIPSAEEMNHGLIKYSPELNFLLATRENLLDLMTETRLNELSDRSAKNRIFREILRHAM